MGKMMKNILKKLARDEEGQAFILVLIFLLVGGLITAPLLSYMSTGLLAGQMYEEKMEGLYAADAGVEDAFWYLKIEQLDVPEDGQPHALPSSPFTINNRTVDVTVENKGNSVFQVIATATSDDGSSTTVESYILSLDFFYFFSNAITSGGEVGNKGSVVGNVEENYDENPWPTAGQLITYYKSQVDVSDPYPDATIDIKDTAIIGPLYRDGDLDIINSGIAGDPARLDGTVYVTGNLDIGKTNQDFTLNLNYNTIYVEGNIEIGGKTTITGSGVIIAVGDIYFSPNIDSNPDNFIFVMSVEGTMWFNPGSDFYGSLAGNIEVQLQPGVNLTWENPSGTGFNFPTGNRDELEIRTWEINPQEE